MYKKKIIQIIDNNNDNTFHLYGGFPIGNTSQIRNTVLLHLDVYQVSVSQLKVHSSNNYCEDNGEATT